jgi:hypothetical protein
MYFRQPTAFMYQRPKPSKHGHEARGTEERINQENDMFIDAGGLLMLYHRS